MKRILFFLFLLCSLTLSAQEVDTTPHKHRFIEFVNRGEFDEAVDLLFLYEDINFNYGRVDAKFLVEFKNKIELLTILSRQLSDDNQTLRYLYVTSDIIKYLEGENSFEYAELLYEISYLLYKSNDFKGAEEYALRSLNIRRGLLEIKDSRYMDVLKALLHIYYEQSKYLEALRCNLEIIQIQKEKFGEENSEYLVSLENLCLLYEETEHYKEAEKYYIESLRLRRKLFGELHEDYATCLHSLGMLHLAQSNYKEAEKLLLKSKQILIRIYKDKDDSYASLLNSLGNLYIEIGHYSKAEKNILESLELRMDLYGEKHPSTANSLHSLALIFDVNGKYLEAEQVLLNVANIQKYNLGELNVEYATTLGILAEVNSHLGNYDTSLKYNIEALNIFKEILGGSNIKYLGHLNNLGVIYMNIGNYIESEQCLVNILQTLERDSNKLNRLYPIILCNLSTLYRIKGNYSESEYYYLEACKFYRNSYIKSLDYMTNVERICYWNTMQIVFDALVLYSTDPTISTLAYDNELFRKGLLLNSSDAVRRSILESGDSALIEQWNELTEAKQVVMHLEEKEPTSSQLEIYRHRADSLEKQMTISSAVFRESKEQWEINWESVKNQLSKNEVAIEYFSAPISQDSTMYCALLLRHNSEYPELITLFEGKEVTDIMSTINESIDNSLLYNYNKYGATLSEKVWSKILPRVKEGETIYFSPSGLLHQLAIEYLPVDSARTMSDVYNMVRLSSTREIVTNKSKESYKSAVVYGGIHYDLDNDNMLAESNRYPGLKRSSLENDSINRGSAIFLPGTKDEAEKINKLLADNKIEAIIYKTKSANEESFKSLSGKHNNILHIATHGFTWTDSTARKQDYFADRIKMQLIGDNQMRGPIIDPLDRCGLLFAGANTALQGKSKELPDGVQDGILTAKEILLMDLRDAELVVLSACETAKGDITSEGVFGLQRAFKMAGAKTIIMSLWKVDDRATQLLMTEFYTNWITKRQPKREAFRNAQNTVKNKYPKPSYWAGFVMLD